MSDPTAPVYLSPARPPRQRSAAPVVLASLLAGLVGGLGGGVLAQTLVDDPAPRVSQEAAAPVATGEPVARDAAAEAAGGIPELSRSVLPSVALISVGPGGQDGQGSGFVVREDGYLVTNHHVVAGSAEGGITVELPGHEPAPAEVVGSDQAYDIAVLKVELDGLAALPFADSDEVLVGQTVVAVGAPLGLDSTVTSGIVSAVDRPVIAGNAGDVSYINAIQTDAAINPGNSGGPLLDLSGRVVGVNSAIAQMPTGALGGARGSIGLGFAIPAEQAERTATQLIETGRSEHPVIGVHIDLAFTGDGARVLSEERDGNAPVMQGGPAAAAGVRPGDVIVEVDGTRITDAQHLLVVLRSHAVGETVTIVLLGEEGDERTVEITLAGSGD
jgi:putative serine protease PepD